MATQPFHVRDIRKRPFVWYDRAVLERFGKQLGPHGIAVYSALAMYADNREQTCYPSFQTIADLTGMSRRQVIREIEKLEQLNLIGVETKAVANEKGKGKETNLFILLDIPASTGDSETPKTSDTQSLVTGSHPTSDTQSPVLVTGSHLNYTNSNYTKRTTGGRENPPPPTENKTADNFSDNPAIQAYKATYPEMQLTPDQAQAIVSRVKNFAAWRATLAEWQLNNYKPGNIANLLDRYEKGLAENGNGKYNGNSRNGHMGRNGTNPAIPPAPGPTLNGKPVSKFDPEYQRQELRRLRALG